MYHFLLTLFFTEAFASEALVAKTRKVRASERLKGNSERIYILHLTILTKNERLIITTMLLDDFAMINF